MPNRYVRHRFDATRHDHIVGSGGDQTDSGGDRLVGADAGHGHGVGGSLERESSCEGCLAGDIRGGDLLDDGAIDDVVDELLVDLGLLQEAPARWGREGWIYNISVICIGF